MGADIQLLIAQRKHKKIEDRDNRYIIQGAFDSLVWLTYKHVIYRNSGGQIYKMIQSETGLFFQKCIYGNEKKARLPKYYKYH